MTPQWLPRVCLLIVVSSGLTLLAEQAPTRDGRTTTTPGTASIAGTIVTGDATRAPVQRATVELSSGQLPLSRYALTDVDGRFEFTGLPAGQFGLTARKPGYVDSAYGAKQSGGAGTLLVVGASDRVTDRTMLLFPGSVLTGAVIDQFGRPAAGMLVRAWHYGISESTGERLPLQPTATRSESLTDDEGGYRLFGLAPGEYIVSAVAAPQAGADDFARPITDAEIQRAIALLHRLRGVAAPAARGVVRPVPLAFGNAPMYYPSADAIADAARVKLGVAEERNGVDVLLRVAQTATVSGTIAATGSAVRAGGTILLADSASQFVRSARWKAGEARFDFPGVPPGTYSVFATPDNSTARGRADVFIAGQDVVTVVYVQPGADISGRMVFESEGGASADPSLARVSLSGVKRGEWPQWESRARADGGFTLAAVAAGTYRMSVWVPPDMQPGWRVKSATLNGVDLLDAPLTVTSGEAITGVVVTLTGARSEIRGTLQAADGRPLADDTIVVFSADPRFWTPLSRRTQVVRPATDGSFSVRDLPAGEYLIAALADVESGQWHEATFLAELAPYGIKVALGDGETKAQNIRVGGGRPQ